MDQEFQPRSSTHFKDTNMECWYDSSNKLHRNGDNPAIVRNKGECKWWYKHGLQHRGGDKPATILPYRKEWWKKGILHRDYDKPAVVYEDSQMWYRRGRFHRGGDKPAFISPMVKQWWKNGKRHRNGQLPAIEYTDGTKLWYKEDELHRDYDKPAHVQPGVYSAWYWNGIRHRSGAKPAVIYYISGLMEWWKFGIRYTETEINSAVKISLWYRRMKKRQFGLLVWRVMTPIYFHPSQMGGKKAITALMEYDNLIPQLLDDYDPI
jgi:hypothetical protein